MTADTSIFGGDKMRAVFVAALAAFCLAMPAQAQLGVCCTHHWQTQLAHGYISTGVTLGAGLAGKAIGRDDGAAIGAGTMLLFYGLREVQAHRYYRTLRRNGDLTPSEYRKATWDSKWDVVGPALNLAVVLGWRNRKDLWPLYLVATAMLVYANRDTEPPGFVFGLD